MMNKMDTELKKKHTFSGRIRNLKLKNVKSDVLSLLSAVRYSFFVTKRSLIAAGILTVILLAAVIYYRGLFFAEESGALLFAAAVAGSLVVGVLTAFHVKMSNKTAKIVNPILFFLVPVVTMCMAE